MRDRAIIGHDDVVGLSFIRNPPGCVFRRYYKNGLRSHILEVLDPLAVQREAEGVIQDGLRRFPRALPARMLRIFRKKFTHYSQALEETRRLEVLERFLGSGHLALSSEFIADYRPTGRPEPILCGLQEFVAGQDLDPWRLPESLLGVWGPSDRNRFIRQEAQDFVYRIRKMIREAGMIPDLAGQGNLLVTEDGRIKLVDINNVSSVLPAGNDIPLDDKGYPVFDKSIQALALMETHLLNRKPDRSEPLYGKVLDPGRSARVRDLEQAFHAGREADCSPQTGFRSLQVSG